MPLLASLALRIRLTTVEHAEAFCRDAAHGLLVDLPGGVPPSAMPGDIELLVDIPHKRTLKLRAHVSRVESTETGALASIRAPGFSTEKAARLLRFVATAGDAPASHAVVTKPPERHAAREEAPPEPHVARDRAPTTRCVPLPLRAAPSRPRRGVKPSALYRSVTKASRRPHASITYMPRRPTTVDEGRNGVLVAMLCALILACAAMISVVG